MSHVVVMVTTSYPRFPGDSVGTFMEPIAKSVAARGHEVFGIPAFHVGQQGGDVVDASAQRTRAILGRDTRHDAGTTHESLCRDHPHETVEG